MPPESLPWDRKDLSKDKKYEKNDVLGSASRWRGAPYGSRDYVCNNTHGHSKSDCYSLFPEDSSHGFAPSSRSNERMVEDDSCKPSASCVEGNHYRSNRETNAFSGGWREHTSEANGTSFNLLNRKDDGFGLRLVDDPVTYNPNSLRDNIYSKDQHDKLLSTDGSGTGHKYEKDTSLGSIAWKPMKWTRSGSFSSRGSGFGLSSSSKGMKNGLDDLKDESQSRKSNLSESPIHTGSGVILTSPSDESCARKKQRLGWGQGLAKYEKQKVECPEEVRNSRNVNPSFPDESPKAIGCSSPATSSSIACSSSPGLEDRHCAKMSSSGNDVDMLSDFGSHVFQSVPEEFSINLENLVLSQVNSVSSLLANILQFDDTCGGDSNFVRSTAINKLFSVKGSILKALEKTESEIDLLENEVKLLNTEPVAIDFCPSNTLNNEGILKSYDNEVEVGSELLPNPTQIEELGIQFSLNEVHDGQVTDKISHTSEVISSQFEGCASDDPTNKFIASSGERSEGTCDINEGNTIGKGRVDVFREESDTVKTVIWASNMDTAKKASDELTKVLPVKLATIDVWEVANTVFQSYDAGHIKEKLARQKHQLLIKEKVLALKFTAFHHLWREDAHLLSMRKHRHKSYKRVEVSNRPSNSNSQKVRSSIRSRCTMPTGRVTLVSIDEAVNFTRKLLANSQVHPYRTFLKMPSLILDAKERIYSRFITQNGLVEDPCAVEKERSLINPWSFQEKALFMNLFSTHGKDFGKIAKSFEHKTIADCIEFYYKNHKSESFQLIKKQLKPENQEKVVPAYTYLVTSRKKWNREVNAASLDMLDAASILSQRGCSYHSSGQMHKDDKPFLSERNMSERMNRANFWGDERDADAAGVLAGISGALSSEAMGSCVTSLVDYRDGQQSLNCQKFNYVGMDRAPTLANRNIDEDDTSDESSGELESIDWTDEEKSNFIMAVRSHGRDFASISKFVGTRTTNQCKAFFSKARKCLGLDTIRSESGNGCTPMSDFSGGRSETEDACVVEIDSAMCSYTSKMDEDLPLTSIDGNFDDSTVTVHEVLTNEKISELNKEDDGMGETTQEESQVGFICKTKNVLLEADAQITTSISSGGTNCLHVDLVHEKETDLVLKKESVTVEESDLISPIVTHIGSELEEDIGQGSSPKRIKTESKSSPNAPPATGFDIAGNSHQQTSDNVICSKNNSILSGRTTDKISSLKPAASTFGFISQYSHEQSHDILPPVQKSRKISWKQKENFPSRSSNSLSMGPFSVHYEDDLHHKATSSFNLEKHGNKLHSKLITADFYQKYLSGNSSNRVDQSPILRGYPLCVFKQGKKDDGVESISDPCLLDHKGSRTLQTSHFSVRHELNSTNFVVPEPPQLVSEVTFLSKSQDHSDAHLKACSKQTSKSDNEERLKKTGDVKLFGQILSHPSPLQRTNSHGNEQINTQSPKSNKPLNLKISEQNLQENSHQSKPENPNVLTRDEYSFRRNYGLWNGNKFQSALSSFSDSGAHLSKYPVTQSSHHMDSSQILGGVPMYSSKDVINASNLDGHTKRIFDRPYGHDFQGDIKRQEIISDRQKRNGFDPMPVFQPDGNLIGMNMVAAGGILVSGGRAGASDPVTSLKMHYVGNGQIGGAVREDDPSWPGGDIGRSSR